MKECFNTARYCSLTLESVIPNSLRDLFPEPSKNKKNPQKTKNTIQVTHLSYLDIIGVLECGGQLLPGWGHGFAVTTPWSKELHKVGTCSRRGEILDM